MSDVSLEIVLVFLVVFSPNGSWRHLVLVFCFGHGANIREIVGAAMAAKMSSMRK